MALAIQILIWIVGVGLAIYVAIFEMFIGGWVDIVTSVVSMVKDTITSGLIKDLVWGIAKIMLAGLSGWLIIAVTVFLSAMTRDYLD